MIETEETVRGGRVSYRLGYYKGSCLSLIVLSTLNELKNVGVVYPLARPRPKHYVLRSLYHLSTAWDGGERQSTGAGLLVRRASFS
jgi:hypothetical protein